MSSMACRGSSEVAAVAASNPEAAPARRLARRPCQCRISLKLKTLSSRTFEPFDPMSDIQSILRNEKKNAILSVIQEVHKNSFQATQNAKILNLIGSMVTLKPLWPMVYYFLRGGDTASALKGMQMTGPCRDDFIAVLEEKCPIIDQKINPKLELKTRLQYKC
ncbi:hypothetical protein quinque_005114 [Culex quinquefasciatus]